MTDHYAVMGNPVSHSKSPRIHSLFAEQTGQVLSYEAIEVQLNNFECAVRDFIEAEGCGLNVTVPFKQEAWALADRRSARAEHAGAANTLCFDEHAGITADNTDGAGLVRDLVENLRISVAGARVLVLGAGGAARGVVHPLIAQGLKQIVIANRTVDKAVSLAQSVAALAPVKACGFETLHGLTFDLIINATSASLDDDVPPIPGSVLAPGVCCYDMMYGAKPTAFLRWAQAEGAAVLSDGLGMLVEQAAESFQIWRGTRPLTAPILAMMRREISA